MNRTTELLHAYTALIRRVSGADAVSLFVPSLLKSAPMLSQDGTPPVPELATAETAAAFAQALSPTSYRFLEDTESAAPNGKLVPVPCSPAPSPGDAVAALARMPRRRAQDATGAPEPPVTCWVGLRFAEGEPGAARAAGALQFLLGKAARDGAVGDDRASLLRLAGVLVWYARHISTVLDDPVTGLAGRAEFQAALHHTLEQAKASGTPVSLLLINPDDFTSVNEKEGHETGDRILREIGSRLLATHRTSDAVAKYGGAIFASFLANTDQAAARTVAEKVWAGLANGAFLDGTLRLGFSIGLAVREPGDPTLESDLELIRRSDKALNAAKRLGGNHVAVWEPGLESRDLGNVDRMTGVYTGNMAKDYRNMKLLSDTMSAIAGAKDVSELVTRVTERLHSSLKTDRIAVFEELHGELHLMQGLETPKDGESPRDPKSGVRLGDDQRALVEDARQQKRALTRTFREASPGEKVLSFAIPLVLNDRSVGCLYLEGGEHRLTLEGSTDLGFLSAFAVQLAVALDRARLAELSRRRSETEQLRLQAEVEELRTSLQRSKLVYCSEAMESLIETVRRVAPTKANILVIGESGTGKELVARTIHELSPFRNKPLVVVDCGAIPTTLIESELFGHERGAYTGAQEKRVGRLLEADGGTVVLDEIGELPLQVQSKLLRFVQEREIIPVGGARVRQVDARLVAVTNRELAVEAAAGRFREDLYYRLNVVRVTVPPLRERRGDILHLAHHFLERYSKQYRKTGLTYSSEARALMNEYRWPGNVRELQHRILQAVILGEGPEIRAAELELEQLPPEQTIEMDLNSIRPAASVSGLSLPTKARRLSGSPQEIWRAVRNALRRQIDAAVSELGAKPVPIGTWFEEDIVMEAFEVSGRVLARAHALVGVPESTFRRRLRKAMSNRSAGVHARTSPWEQMTPLLSDLVRTPASTPDEDLLQTARSVLLSEVLASAVGVTTAAALMGVTVRTYRRWTAETTTEASSISPTLFA